MSAVCGTIRIPTRHRPLHVISQIGQNQRPELRGKQADNAPPTDRRAREAKGCRPQPIPPGGGTGPAQPAGRAAVSNRMNTCRSRNGSGNGQHKHHLTQPSQRGRRGARAAARPRGAGALGGPFSGPRRYSPQPTAERRRLTCHAAWLAYSPPAGSGPRRDYSVGEFMNRRIMPGRINQRRGGPRPWAIGRPSGVARVRRSPRAGPRKIPPGPGGAVTCRTAPQMRRARNLPARSAGHHGSRNNYCQFLRSAGRWDRRARQAITRHSGFPRAPPYLRRKDFAMKYKGSGAVSAKKRTNRESSEFPNLAGLPGLR